MGSHRSRSGACALRHAGRQRGPAATLLVAAQVPHDALLLETQILSTLPVLGGISASVVVGWLTPWVGVAAADLCRGILGSTIKPSRASGVARSEYRSLPLVASLTNDDQQ